jgi:hypothetical protein
MPHPYVTRVTLMDGLIVLTVEFDKTMAGLSFELAGSATQNGGAFANFYDVKDAEATEDGTVVAYVKTKPLREFKNGEDVTVVLRAARVWATVLTQAKDALPPGHAAQAWAGTQATDGTTWNNIRAVEWVPSTGSPAWNSVRASAGGATFPAAQPDGPSTVAAQPDRASTSTA